MADYRGPVHVLDGVAPVLEVLAPQALTQGLLQHPGCRVAGGVLSVHVHGPQGGLVCVTDELQWHLLNFCWLLNCYAVKLPYIAVALLRSCSTKKLLY